MYLYIIRGSITFPKKLNIVTSIDSSISYLTYINYTLSIVDDTHRLFCMIYHRVD